MDEAKILEMLGCIQNLGIFANMMGVLRAFSKGIITRAEYDAIKEWAHTNRGIPRDWFRIYVWSTPM